MVEAVVGYGGVGLCCVGGSGGRRRLMEEGRCGGDCGCGGMLSWRLEAVVEEGDSGGGCGGGGCGCFG